MPLYNRLFLSASDIGSYKNTAGGTRLYGVPKKEVAGVGSEFVPDLLVWSNLHIYEPISGSENTFGFPLRGINWNSIANSAYNSYFLDGVDNPPYRLTYFNTLMNKRNGAYQYPMWKQIRNNDHPLVRWQRENNIIPFLEESNYKYIIGNNGDQIAIKPKRSGIITQYTEPPVVVKYKPMIIELSEGKYLDAPLKLQFSYGNIVGNFSNSELNKKANMSKTINTIYDRIKELHYGESEENRAIDGINTIIYAESIFPSETNVFMERTRNRKLFYFPWRHERSDRLQTNVKNSQGYIIPYSSIWPMDARTDMTAEAITSSNGEGELQNKYTTFYGNERFVVNPTMQGDFVNNAIWFNMSPNRDYNSITPYINYYDQTLSPYLGSFRSARLTCSAPWDDFVGADMSISMWIYQPNTYKNHSNYIPDKQTLIEFGKGNRGLYVVTSSLHKASVADLGMRGADANDAKFDMKEILAGRTPSRRLLFSASYSTAPDDGGEWLTLDNCVNIDTWYHVVATFDSDNATMADRVKIYVNSVSEDLMASCSQATAGDLDAISPQTIYIASSSQCKTSDIRSNAGDATNGFLATGREQNMPYFGFMKDISIYNTVLDQTEVNELYNNGLPSSLLRFSKKGNLVSWWRMGEGNGYFTASGYGPNIDSGNKSFINDNYFAPGSDHSFETNYFPATSSLSINRKYNFSDRIHTSSIEGTDLDMEKVMKIFYELTYGGVFDVPVAMEQYRNIIFDMASNNHLICSQSGKINNGTAIYNNPLTYISDFSELNNHLYGYAQKDRYDVGGWCEDFKVGAQFSRPEMVYVDKKKCWVTSSGSPDALTYYKLDAVAGVREERFFRVTGSRKYINEVVYNADKTPYNDSYDDFSSEVISKGRDYSLIPEFRISERMDYYLDTQKGDFFKQDDSFLTLTGSQNYKDSSINDFYKVYSHTDFMKNFGMIQSDFGKDLQESKLKLKCSAILKLNPYNGFYPVQRTLQMAELFSKSYGDYVHPKGYIYKGVDGTVETEAESTASWRSFLTPFFAPGILYNSIKSGMAVDFPIYNTMPHIVQDFQLSLYGGGGIDYQSGCGPRTGGTSIKPDYQYRDSTSRYYDLPSILLYSTRWVGIYGFPFNATSSMWICSSSGETANRLSTYMYLGHLSYSQSPPNGLEIKPMDEDNYLQWYSCLSKEFDKRLPFEALIEPGNYVSREKIYDMNPEFSSSLNWRLLNYDTNQASYWGGEEKVQYRLAMHNFLAETVNFFLKDNKMSILSSKEIIKDSGIIIREGEENKWYGMDVYISNSKCKSYTDFHEIMATELDERSNIYNKMPSKELDELKGIHTRMYHRDSSFGPPYVDGNKVFTSPYSMFAFHFGYEPFTPAYFNGFGVARMMFFPFKGSGVYTLDEVQQGTKVYYYRTPTNREGRGCLYKYDKMLEYSSILSVDGENILDQESSNFSYKVEGRRIPRVRELHSPNYMAYNILKTTNNWQQLSGTLNLFGKVKVRNVTFEKGIVNDFDPVSITDNSVNTKELWVIEPKWETPIFNFINKQPISSSKSYENDYNVSGGIWTQYGDMCAGKEGIYMGIADLPNKSLYSYKLDFEIGQQQYVYDQYSTVTGHPKMNLKKCTGKEKPRESYHYAHQLHEYDEYYPLGVGYYDGRKENEKYDKKEKGYIVLYIKDTSIFPVNEYNIYFKLGTWSDTYFFVIESTPESNWDVAKQIAESLNSQTYKPYFNASRFFSAEAFIPEKHPWSNDTTLTTTIAAVKIYLNDNIDSYPMSLYCLNGDYTNNVSVYLGIGSSPTKYMLEGVNSKGQTIFATPTTFKKLYFYSGKQNQYKVESLADLLGFPKTERRMGEVSSKKEIKEAIVAIPFIEVGSRKQFFSITRRDIDIASGERKKIDNEKQIGNSIVDMVLKMKDYVFPPFFDFLNNKKINPFAMYIFEFKYNLSKQELGDIWQNVMPKISTSFQTDEVIIEHPILSNEFFKGKLQTNLRWMVFKVKQKAKINYYEMTTDQKDDDRFNFTFNIGGDKKTIIPQYSYNWPYDYFSLIEMAKIDAEVEFKKK